MRAVICDGCGEIIMEESNPFANVGASTTCSHIDWFKGKLAYGSTDLCEKCTIRLNKFLVELKGDE